MDNRGLKLEFNSNTNDRKHVEIEHALLNHLWVKEEVKDFIEFNKNEGTMYANLWNTMRAVIRGMFMVLIAYIKKMEKSHTSDLAAHLKF